MRKETIQGYVTKALEHLEIINKDRVNYQKGYNALLLAFAKIQNELAKPDVPALTLTEPEPVAVDETAVKSASKKAK